MKGSLPLMAFQWCKGYPVNSHSDIALHAIINGSNYANVCSELITCGTKVMGCVKKVIFNPRYKQVLISLPKND